MLPSSHDLSSELSVARNTVLAAYSMLVSEGVIYSIAGSGFYVCSDIKNVPQNTFIQDQQTASLSNQIISNQIINSDSRLPALDLFPRENWNRVVSHAFLDAPVSALGYDHPQGRPEFRDVIALIEFAQNPEHIFWKMIMTTHLPMMHFHPILYLN